MKAVRIHVPKLQNFRQSSCNTSTCYEGSSVNKRAILVVEDSFTDEALLLRALNKFGVTNPIVTVKDGFEAIEYLFATGRYESRKAEDLPAIVVIDLNLPKLDGLEVLRRLRADYRT